MSQPVPTVYIAGPMRGIPEFNFPAFIEAAQKLRACGYNVLSPAEHDMTMGFKWQGTTGHEPVDAKEMYRMQEWDIAQVRSLVPKHDRLYVLPGWQDSKGARAEIALADWNGVKVVLARQEPRAGVDESDPGVPPVYASDYHAAIGPGIGPGYVQELPIHRAGIGDPRFHALLREIGDLHDKKQQDYGTAGDAFANVRASEDFGVAPWIGALVRLNDKVTRLKQFAKRDSLANESAADSLMDISVYALIALILYREQGGGKEVANAKA